MSTRKSPRLLGVSVPQDKGPLTGKPRKENTRKRKARTPAAAASEQAEATPERVELDFTFKNAWMARVAQGFTKEEVVDLALSTRRPYERAKAAGVPLPDIPGRYDNVTMGNFDGVVQALDKLAEFGNWDHSGEPPDLPAEYADAPSLSNAAATLACGIELTGSLHNKTLPKKSQTKAPTGSAQIQGLGVKPPEFDELSQNVLKGLLQRCFSFSSMRFNLYKKWQHDLVGGWSCCPCRCGCTTNWGRPLAMVSAVAQW